jgi:hypothetical protein
MATAAQPDWSYYKTREGECDATWLRSLSVGERFALYEDMFNILWAARAEMSGNWARLEQRQWAEKIDRRQRLVEAFLKRDQVLSERAAAHHAL